MEAGWGETSKKVDGPLKTRSLANTCLALCSVATLLSMPWAASAYGSLGYRSTVAAGATEGVAGEWPLGVESRTAQRQPAQAPPAWQIRTVDGAGVGYYTSLALDANGYPHISYSDNDNQNPKYAHWTGRAWANQTVTLCGNR